MDHRADFLIFMDRFMPGTTNSNPINLETLISQQLVKLQRIFLNKNSQGLLIDNLRQKKIFFN